VLFRSEAPLAAFSCHESKNFSCGEGGAPVVNQPELVERAAFLQEKGTDRSLVVKGLRSKYSWVDVGSSYLLADILAAMLLAQLEQAEVITEKRAQITTAYYSLFEPYRQLGWVLLPQPPPHVTVNHHAFFVIFDTAGHRDQFLAGCWKLDIHPYIGYMPLHSSLMGRKFGYQPEDLPLTEDLASRLVRLPFYTALAGVELEYCVEGMERVLKGIYY
jgi:dTDP-4-amino-4,6-dideoxygalactose transaminase